MTDQQNPERVWYEHGRQPVPTENTNTVYLYSDRDNAKEAR